VNRTVLPYLSAALCLVAIPALAGSSYQGQFQKTLQLSGAANLEVFTHSGDVTIHSGSAGTMTIVGRIHVGDHWLAGNRKSDVSQLESNPPIHQEGNRVKVDYVPFRDISIDYDITLPADTAVRAESGSGNLTIDGLQSGVDGRTGSGDVRLDHISGNIRVQSGSGNITGERLAGPLDVNASSGDIRLEETAQGDVRAHTGSGNIEIKGIEGSVRAEAGSGNVEVQGKPSSSWYVRTGSGNAELALAGDSGFDLDVSTGSGTINVDHPVTTTVQGRIESPQKSITGKVRGGGPQVEVHTGSGDIRIR